MARLIDANALSKKWQDMLDIKTGEKEEIAVYKIFEILIKRLSQEPTIDPVTAAGACYCWECKYARKVDKREPKYKCVNICRDGCTQWLGSDDFCSYGERLESND